MPEYRLTGAAEQDLIGIAQYGDENFGTEQSDRYRDQLKARFSIIAAHLLRYPAVDHIRKDYRRTVCGQHSIYYRIDSTEIVIVRVLREQDPKASLVKGEKRTS